MSRSLLLCCFLYALAACSDAPQVVSPVRVDTLPGGIVRTMSNAPSDPGKWSLVALRDIAPEEGAAGELENPSSIAIDDDGSIVVYESGANVIKVYGPDGELARTFGRNGQGPGEFQSGFIALVGDTLLVQDPANTRITSFLWRTGALLEVRRSVCCYWSPIYTDGLGRAWARSIASAPDTTSKHAQGFVRYAASGDRADTIFAYERPGLPEPKPWLVREGSLTRMSMTVPLQPRAVWAIDRSGALITGFSGEYSLRVTTHGIDTVAIFGRDWTAEDVAGDESAALVDTAVARIRKSNPTGTSEQVLRVAFDPALIPSRRPAYDKVDVDGAGRRWVWRSRRIGTDARFDLFDSTGVWLDSLSVPAASWVSNEWRPVSWGSNSVAIVLEGEDGRPLIRVYEIRRGN
jgi:hypothetical protein